MIASFESLPLFWYTEEWNGFQSTYPAAKLWRHSQRSHIFFWERISYDYIVGKCKRVENCPINLLHFPKEKTDNETRVYKYTDTKQSISDITDIQVKTRTPKRRSVHWAISDLSERKVSVLHSNASPKKPSNNNKVADMFSNEASWSTVDHLSQELVQSLVLNPLAASKSLCRARKCSKYFYLRCRIHASGLHDKTKWQSGYSLEFA